MHDLAIFLVARALTGQEFSVRPALAQLEGAGAQVLIESACSALRASAGLVLAFGPLHIRCRLLCIAHAALDLHFGLDWRALFDWRVLALTGGAGVLAGGLLGLVPAVQGTRADLGSTLTTGARGSDAPGPLRWRNVMVVAQIAMSLVLLAGAGLFLRSWQQMLAVDPASAVLRRRYVRPDAVARSTPDAACNERGVCSSTFEPSRGPRPSASSGRCRSSSRPAILAHIDGACRPPARDPTRDRAFVDGGFFDAAGMAIVAGRTFNDDDRATLSRGHHHQAMARRYWPDGGALGRILPGRSGRARPADRRCDERHHVRSLGKLPATSSTRPTRKATACGGQLRRPHDYGPGADVTALAARPGGRSVLTGDAVDDADAHLATSRLPSQIAPYSVGFAAWV